MSSPRSAFHATTPFVGRSVEYGWLEERLKVAASGRPQVVVIRGDAGIGKTRIVRELQATATRAGLRVWHGRAREDVALPYLAFEPLLAELAGGDPDRQSSPPDALRILVGSTSDADASSEPKAGADRQRLFQRIVQAVFERARAGPILVVLEDLHWADGASLDLLAHLTYAASDAPDALSLALVATVRPFEGSEQMGRILERIGREDPCHTLELAGLDEREVEAMIRACGVAEPSRQLVGRIAEVTLGNPLFVQEILHVLDREGALVERGGRWLARDDPAELCLPEHVAHAIASRMENLSAPCREVLVTAACFGEHFAVEDLEGFGGSQVSDLRRHLDEALRARVLASHGDRLQFAHPLMRQALYGSTSPFDRRRIHRRIATALEHLHADDLDVHVSRIAHHWIHGQERGDAEIVSRYACRAGDHALAIFAPGEAARFYEAALAVGDAPARLGERAPADLHLRAGMAHYRNMDAGPALEHFARAVGLFERTGDVAGLARALREQVRTRYTLAPVGYGTLIDVSELERALERLGDEEPALRGWILVTLTDVFMHGRRPNEAERCARRARAIGEKIADDRLVAAAAITLGTVHSQRLEARLALEACREGHRSALRSGDPWVEGWALQRMPLALVWLGRLEEAEATRQEASRVARRTGDWADHSIAMGTGAVLAGLRGDFAAVEREAHETMAMVRRSGYPWGGFVALSALYAARALRGKWEEARDALAILEEPGRVFEEGGPAARAIAAVGRLRLRALAQDFDLETREQLEGLSKVMQSVGPEVGTIGASCAFVEIADLLGDRALAEASLPALEVAEAGGVVFAGGGEFLLPRVQGVAAGLGGRWNAAEAYFERAVATALEAGARPDLARAELDRARMHIARGASGDRELASEELLRAIAILRELGMVPFLARATELARELGAPAQAAVDGTRRGPDEPTPRELQVLEAVARGRSGREIADELLLREVTVRRLTETLFGKLGVDGRTGATAYAFERGLALPTAARPRPLSRGGDAGLPRIIFVSDIEQSTALIQRLGDAAAQQLVHEHNRIVRACVRDHRGSEIQHTGDGFIVSFDSALRGVECAIEIQRELARRNRSVEESPLRVRIGLHAGTPLPEEGRFFGVAMNTAARICSRSAPAQILVSEAVRLLCEGSKFVFDAAGEASLKGIERPVALHRVVWDTGETQAHTQV